MALTGDYYVGVYEGHSLALVRNNWNKTLKLLIDGQEVARGSCLLPGEITLAGTLEHDGVRHAVIARSVPRRLVFTTDAIAVDGADLPLASESPRGLFQAALRDAGQGHPASVVLVGALALLGLASLFVVASFMWGPRLR
jgi:hypothetical protein